MVAELYHGSTTRAFAYRYFLHPISRGVQAIRLAIKGVRKDPQALALLRRGKRLVHDADYAGALAAVRKAADIVEANPKVSTRSVGAALICLGDCSRGLRLVAPRVLSGDVATWRGENLSDAALVIHQRIRSDMGSAIALSRFVSHAKSAAKRCVVVVEHRLVPLLQRSLPGTDVIAMGAPLPDLQGKRYDVVFERLASYFVTDWPSVERSFAPVIADSELTAEFRRKYRSSTERPLIGITWGSRNSSKGVPELAEWARLIQEFPATFVSLQYGKVDAAVEKLRGRQPDKLIDDTSVDQLKDMDRFAAQVAAMDAVIGISNTATHLAGSLGVPLVLIRDDRFGRYPIEGDRTRWYPTGVMVRRHQRPWSAVMAEAVARLSEQARIGRVG